MMRYRSGNWYNGDWKHGKKDGRGDYYDAVALKHYVGIKFTNNRGPYPKK